MVETEVNMRSVEVETDAQGVEEPYWIAFMVRLVAGCTNENRRTEGGTVIAVG